MAHEQTVTGCNHGPFHKGPYSKRCKACGRVEIVAGYNDYFERAVRKGIAPFCAICGESMDERYLLHFECKCGFEKRYRPAIVGYANGLATIFNKKRALKSIFYDTEIANIPHFCFLCDYGAFRKIAELTIQCDCCGLTIKRKKDKVVFEVSYKSD